MAPVFLLCGLSVINKYLNDHPHCTLYILSKEKSINYAKEVCQEKYLFETSVSPLPFCNLFSNLYSASDSMPIQGANDIAIHKLNVSKCIFKLTFFMSLNPLYREWAE